MCCRTAPIALASHMESQMIKPTIAFLLTLILLGICTSLLAEPRDTMAIRPYAIVDTGQSLCYDNNQSIDFPESGQPFYGQDAQYVIHWPQYREHGDGTISDLVTGLMWTKEAGDKKTFSQAKADALACRTGGHADWRVPTIQELYSLILFSGMDVSPESRAASSPFIDTRYFGFRYGEASRGERLIDAQHWSCTEYLGTTMGGNATVFGVNFADGRIKGYPRDRGARGSTNRQFALFVRGNTRYGHNDFSDNQDGTVTDRATGLVWQQADSGRGMNWAEALAYAQDLTLGGKDDWRLPDAKELQSIVEYRRAPDATASAAIDPILKITAMTNEARETDYPFFWTSTTHASANGKGMTAVYLSFGRALGFFQGQWMDVHGAGAQRSDPKAGAASQYPQGRGPQGDAIRILNFVRCVRGGDPVLQKKSPPSPPSPLPTLPKSLPSPESRLGKFVGRLDKNGDGKITASEFDGPPDQFPFLDRNQDGFLTEDEAPPPPRSGRMHPDPRPSLP